MNEKMIEKWNKKVAITDQVYILGDFFFGKGEDAEKLIKRLNGQKFLIKGNHDSFLRDKFNTSCFGWVKDYYVLKQNNTKFVLFHYPIQVWDCKHHGSIHLYGHVHSNKENHHPLLAELGNAYNVGVDVNDFEPISLEEIMKKVGV
jgi:calcineurin-like phosphoesterase family protein